MSRTTYPLRLPNSIKRAAERLAKEDGVSLNQWIAAAVAGKVGVVETAAEFFANRAGSRTGAALIKFAKRAPKRAPDKVMNSTNTRPRLSTSKYRFLTNLLVHRNLDDLLLDRVGHQLGLVMDVQLAHQVELMSLHCFHAQAQNHGYLFY
jgi:HicB family